jgi:DNA ligase (NAD+)
MSNPENAFYSQYDFDMAVGQAQAAAEDYYDSDYMGMTDAEYDALVERIEDTKAAHPDWDDKGVTTEVAAGASAGGDVKHPVAMLSLGKVRVTSDLEKFVAIVGGPLVVEVKLDGLAIRAEYVDGNLTQAVTRGDGLSGEDVTVQAKRFGGIHGLPITLSKPWTGEIRGEVFMTDKNFDAANINRVAAGGTAFVNPRNATAGSLRKADREYATPMSFGAYDISGETVDDQPDYTLRMFFAANLGFTTALSLTPMNLTKNRGNGALDRIRSFFEDRFGQDRTAADVNPTADALDVLDRIAHIGEQRATLGYPIDGAVIKAEQQADRDRLGMASRTPRWATSFKYAADTATTVLKDIEVQIGRTGRITLRALLEPVFVGGTTITYATLHHPGFVYEHGFAIGQTVAVYRAGDVIPRVTAAMGEQPEGLAPWVAPETCPQCGEAWDKSSVLWRCHTPECSVAGRIAFFASRDCMDIEGLSESTAEALAESGLVSNVADLFDLTVADLAAVKTGKTSSTGTELTIGTGRATSILAELDRAKSQPFNRVITSLGIRMTGRSVGRWLAREFHTMDRLRAATVTELASIEKLGDIKANHIAGGLESMGHVIDRLAAAGVNMGEDPSGTDAADLPLAGKTYVVSGSVPGYTRTTVAERIESLGGKASSSVSKTTTALVTDDPSTSKGVKALSLGIPVMDPADFLALIGE